MYIHIQLDFVHSFPFKYIHLKVFKKLNFSVLMFSIFFIKTTSKNGIRKTFNNKRLDDLLVDQFRNSMFSLHVLYTIYLTVDHQTKKKTLRYFLFFHKTLVTFYIHRLTFSWLNDRTSFCDYVDPYSKGPICFHVRPRWIHGHETVVTAKFSWCMYFSWNYYIAEQIE